MRTIKLMWRLILFAVMVGIPLIHAPSFGQDIAYVRACIDSLASPRYHGRAYVNDGERIAAEFIRRNLKESGIKSMGDDYFQPFTININTFPGKMELKAGDISLVPGKDFYVALSSPAVSGTFKTLWLDKNSLKTEGDVKKFLKKDLSDLVLIIDTGFDAELDRHAFTARVIIKTQSGKMSWHVADGEEVLPFVYINVLCEKIPENCPEITLDIAARYRRDYPTQNIIGYIPGTQYPDSFMVFTAHYDHLGRMGEGTYFPGAHDNASGCAMLMDLARHYSQPLHQPECSVAFIFFSAEEAGLLGSEFFVDHPLFPLDNIKFLINLDMESTGSQGIKVVNGSIFTEHFDRLVKINNDKQYLKNVSPRGEAANSDHYHFYKNGINCFYIYTLGDEWKEYHTPTDVSQGLPMTKYIELFGLITDFVKELCP